jgi:hypothetical protein
MVLSESDFRLFIIMWYFSKLYIVDYSVVIMISSKSVDIYVYGVKHHNPNLVHFFTTKHHQTPKNYHQMHKNYH